MCVCSEFLKARLRSSERCNECVYLLIYYMCVSVCAGYYDHTSIRLSVLSRGMAGSDKHISL